ncbi:MAG: hypothetical protein WBR26_05955 [Candidatus Acidiferrum sp.]
MARRSSRGGRPLPHAQYGVDLAKLPDTYIEPFVAYRTWDWTAEGVTSLNGALWTPKVAFEATCHYAADLCSMRAAAIGSVAAEFWESKSHHVPGPGCTCGMYAGINMQHMIDINYIQRGIHGEVSLWGRLERNTKGWRAQYGYPKFFVVPVNMIPFRFDEAHERLKALVEFDVDIYLQPEGEARVGQEKIPLWIRDYGYSQQGISFLIEKRQKWYSGEKAVHPLAVGDRIAVLGGANGGGIGVVREIDGDEMYYTLFSLNVSFHKKVKDVVWNERNWRWETKGTGFLRKLEQAMGR